MITGKIFVDDIIVEAFIGINPDEQLCKQRVKFGFSLEYDWEVAISSDAIKDAVNYASLTEELKAFISESKFSLLESLVFKTAENILLFSPKITKAKVYCKKVDIMPGASEVGAEVELGIWDWGLGRPNIRNIEYET
jgi:FolB domain-containing protein